LEALVVAEASLPAPVALIASLDEVSFAAADMAALASDSDAAVFSELLAPRLHAAIETAPTAALRRRRVRSVREVMFRILSGSECSARAWRHGQCAAGAPASKRALTAA
jgi:hypothetical protein